jgi:hypothetical protein
MKRTFLPFAVVVSVGCLIAALTFQSAPAQSLNPTSGSAVVYPSEKAAITAVWQQLQAPNGIWSYAPPTSGLVNTTTAVTIKAAAGTGKRTYVTSCTLSHDTLGAATEFVLRDGAAGTVIFRRKLQTTAIESATLDFRTPLRSSANTQIEAAELTAVTGGVYLNCQGYTD